MGKIIVSEKNLNKIIAESIKKKLNEISNQQSNLETYYKGYNSKYGSQHDHMLWITDDISYARTYGNRVEEIVLDLNKLKLAYQ